MNAHPFEVGYTEVEANTDIYVDAIFNTLQSAFLLLPRGPGFIPYPEFQQAYEILKRETGGFKVLEPSHVLKAISEDSLAFVVLRTILGFSPPEWAYVTTSEAEVTISQGFARNLDRQFRTERRPFESTTSLTQKRVRAMVSVACQLIQEGAGEVPEEMIHRLDMVDTRSGVESIRHLAAEGVPYAVLLYEQFLGRPFASHRDSVSELVGEVMENAVEEELRKAGISFRKTKRAEKIEGFDQAPDFIVPDEWNPQVVVEAKITEDDGTARDKVTRIQHLAEIGRKRELKGESSFQVIACIDGRGFGIRREDMQKLLAATRGKVFTLKTLHHLVGNTQLLNFRTFPSDRPEK